MANSSASVEVRQQPVASTLPASVPRLKQGLVIKMTFYHSFLLFFANKHASLSLSLSNTHTHTHAHNSGVWYPLNDSQVGLKWLSPAFLSLSVSLAVWGCGKRRLSNAHTSRLPNWVSAHPISAQGPRCDEWPRCLASSFRSLSLLPRGQVRSEDEKRDRQRRNIGQRSQVQWQFLCKLDGTVILFPFFC